MLDYTSLMTKGFLKVSNFLNSEEIAEFIAVYDQIKKTYINENYNVFTSFINAKYESKYQELAKEIAENTDILVNQTLGCSCYFDTAETDLIWHQDHEPYYKWQGGYDFLTFWTPLIKPNAQKSGLSVLPFDKMRSLNLDFVKNELWGKGAKFFYPEGNLTKWTDDDSGKETTGTLNFNINDIAESPDLSAGDLLIFRGDTAHRTQDTSTRRLAFSVRMVNSEKLLLKERFFTNNARKQSIIEKSKNPLYQIINNRFAVYDKFPTRVLIEQMKELKISG